MRWTMPPVIALTMRRCAGTTVAFVLTRMGHGTMMSTAATNAAFRPYSIQRDVGMAARNFFFFCANGCRRPAKGTC